MSNPFDFMYELKNAAITISVHFYAKKSLLATDQIRYSLKVVCWNTPRLNKFHRFLIPLGHNLDEIQQDNEKYSFDIIMKEGLELQSYARVVSALWYFIHDQNRAQIPQDIKNLENPKGRNFQIALEKLLTTSKSKNDCFFGDSYETSVSYPR